MTHRNQLACAYLCHLAIRRRETTIGTYRDILRLADRQLPAGLARATTEEIEAWVYDPARSPATQALRRAALRGFYRWAVRQEELDYDPCTDLPPVTVPEQHRPPISAGLLRQVFAQAGEPYRLWLLLAAYEGLRCAGIAQLDREHVTETQTWVHGKGGKNRIVPTHPVVWRVVRDLPPGPVAGGLDRRQISARGNRYLHSLGYPGLHMHLLRHWYATEVYRASGEDLRLVQVLLGHASIATTQRYLAVATSRQRDAVAGLPNVA